MEIGEIVLKRFPRFREQKYSVFFCLDDAIATCTNFFNESYEIMYNHILCIDYDENSKEPSRGKRIQVSNASLEELEKYCGVHMEAVIKDKKELLHTVIQEIGNGRPVIAAMDAFWCPWDWRYQMIPDGGHSVVIVGYDSVKKSLVCIDPYYEQENLQLEENCFLQGCNELGVISYQHKDEKQDVLDVFRQGIEHMLATNYFDVLAQLACDIQKEFRIENEILNYCPTEKVSMEDLERRIVISEAFLRISNNRQRYASLIKYIGEQEASIAEPCNEFVERMVYLSEKWDMLRFIIIKRFFASNVEDIPKLLSNKIIRIAFEEKELLKDILDVLNGQLRSSSGKLSYKEESKIKDYIPLDLSDYYNNEGVGDMENCTADFNHTQEFYLEEDFSKKSVICWNQIQYRLPSKEEHKEDNIVCLGQAMSVEENRYGSISFLGCADWGNFSDDVFVRYSDGSKESYRLNFLDWVPSATDRSKTNEVMSLRGVNRKHGKNEIDAVEHKIYASTIYINDEKKVKELILPECSNIHIFSISLGKSE